jgi:hypothetical protein
LFSVFVVSCRSGNKSSSAATKALSSSITSDGQNTSVTTGLVLKLGERLEIPNLERLPDDDKNIRYSRITFENITTTVQKAVPTKLVNTKKEGVAYLKTHAIPFSELGKICELHDTNNTRLTNLYVFLYLTDDINGINFCIVSGEDTDTLAAEGQIVALCFTSKKIKSIWAGHVLFTNKGLFLGGFPGIVGEASPETINKIKSFNITVAESKYEFNAN